MCWVISTGTRSMRGAEPVEETGQRLRAAGRGADQQNARQHRGERPQLDVGARGASGCATAPRRQCRRAASCRRAPSAQRLRGGAAELADLLDQFARNVRRGRDLAIGLRLRDVVGGAERQRLEADLGVAARQRRRHDDDEVALLLEQQRQRRNAVELRHLDVEQHDVRIDALDCSTASRPVRSEATTSSPGSASIQRDTRPRTTTASSTTMTRIGSLVAAFGGRQAQGWQQRS